MVVGFILYIYNDEFLWSRNLCFWNSQVQWGSFRVQHGNPHIMIQTIQGISHVELGEPFLSIFDCAVWTAAPFSRFNPQCSWPHIFFVAIFCWIFSRVLCLMHLSRISKLFKEFIDRDHYSFVEYCTPSESTWWGGVAPSPIVCGGVGWHPVREYGVGWGGTRPRVRGGVGWHPVREYVVGWHPVREFVVGWGCTHSRVRYGVALCPRVCGGVGWQTGQVNSCKYNRLRWRIFVYLIYVRKHAQVTCMGGIHGWHRHTPVACMCGMHGWHARVACISCMHRLLVLLASTGCIHKLHWLHAWVACTGCMHGYMHQNVCPGFTCTSCMHEFDCSLDDFF